MNRSKIMGSNIIAGVLLTVAANAYAKSIYPASDPDNSGGWKLNRDVSDEFNSKYLDKKKWLVQGYNGEFKSRWIGRAPSQFSTENVRVSGGKLKVQTRWEPDFDFSDKPGKDGSKYENITTAAVISRETFQYGYMEIRCKAADASITSSFWMTGKGSELDIFEFNGRPSANGKKGVEKEMMFTMIDWKTGKNVRMWRDKAHLAWRVADDFHVYGCEWNEDYLKFFADGELVGEVTREQLGDKWVLVNPHCVWVDSETFPWQGLPSKEDLPVDFEIDYIRIWQTK